MVDEKRLRAARSKIRIATLYKRVVYYEFKPYEMSLTRWLRVSEALASLGYSVDMIVNDSCGLIHRNRHLRHVPYVMVDWKRYDVVKTLFHRGFDALCHEGGGDHPFIVSKLGSVVGQHDATEGVHFFGQERTYLHGMQRSIAEKSRYVSVLTHPSKCLWEEEFGNRENVLMVPTGVDRTIPAPGNNPYEEFPERIAVYIGTIYGHSQKEVNLLWQSRFNTLGTLLKGKGIRLCFVGLGDMRHLDHKAVTYLGPVENDRVWDYQYFADVGLTLAQGKVQHNESSKIYYYLRTGLPVVSEEPIPNNYLISDTKLGFVADYADNQMMAEMIEAAIYRKWDREEAIRHMVENHTWDKRAQIYDEMIRKEFMDEDI